MTARKGKQSASTDTCLSGDNVGKEINTAVIQTKNNLNSEKSASSHREAVRVSKGARVSKAMADETNGTNGFLFEPRGEKAPPVNTENSFTIMTFNVNGVRAAIKKGLVPFLEYHQPSVLCLQEVKAQAEDCSSLINELEAIGYSFKVWHASTQRKGYAGTAVFSKLHPITHQTGLPGLDDVEGRVIMLEYSGFYLINTYVPNAGQKLERLTYRTVDWDTSMFKYLKFLEVSKENMRFAYLIGTRQGSKTACALCAFASVVPYTFPFVPF